jgi:hypothetical protein
MFRITFGTSDSRAILLVWKEFCSKVLLVSILNRILCITNSSIEYFCFRKVSIHDTETCSPSMKQ